VRIRFGSFSALISNLRLNPARVDAKESQILLTAEQNVSHFDHPLLGRTMNETLRLKGITTVD
jgi:hypothetical protein